MIRRSSCQSVGIVFDSGAGVERLVVELNTMGKCDSKSLLMGESL